MAPSLGTVAPRSVRDAPKRRSTPGPAARSQSSNAKSFWFRYFEACRPILHRKGRKKTEWLKPELSSGRVTPKVFGPTPLKQAAPFYTERQEKSSALMIGTIFRSSNVKSFDPTASNRRTHSTREAPKRGSAPGPAARPRSSDIKSFWPHLFSKRWAKKVGKGASQRKRAFFG